MPIGTDLVLREKSDHEEILRDGVRLGKILEESARRYQTPLAFPVMDLQLEKAALLEKFDVPAGAVPSYHFAQCPDAEKVREVIARIQAEPLPVRMQANCGAITYIATHTNLMPVGMCIGPFSLMTKLLADPITPVYLSGTGATGEEDEEVKLVETCLELAMAIILESLKHQIKAGAKAIFVAEPAANKVYLSPNQIDAGSDVFERLVILHNLKIKALLDASGVDLVFHCCGELTDYMLRKFTLLEPAMLSLGSSRNLWEDAAIVPDTIVLYGNLPSKKFYSDECITRQEVEKQARDLVEKMRGVNHPFILGTECDTLSVPGCEKVISEKVEAMISCDCGNHFDSRV